MNLTFDEKTHTYKLDGQEVPSVTQLISHFGLSDFSMVNQAVLDRACEFGDNVHCACQLWDEKDLNENSLGPELRAWLNQWIALTSDYAPQWQLIEKPIVSKAWGFAGTPDRIGLINHGTVLDIKTCAPAPAHAIQTAAYQILAEEAGYKIKQRMTVYLSADKYRIDVHKDRNDRLIFMSMIQIYNWKKRKGLK